MEVEKIRLGALLVKDNNDVQIALSSLTSAIESVFHLHKELYSGGVNGEALATLKRTIYDIFHSL